MRRRYNMEVIKYERTWCDHFTPCPYLRFIDVGSYECSICPYFKGCNLGEVTCSYKSYKEEHQDESDNK